VERLREAQRVLALTSDVANRTPHFCSGCPHNTSTRVPEGMRAYAGIGCHYMVQWMDRQTDGFTQMGGEGANWIGENAFSNRKHVFQNLGDGTYNHSGSLALRWAIHTKTNVTYKILFNDAGRHDRAASARGRAHGRHDRPAGAGRGRGAHRARHRRARQVPLPIQWPAGMSIHHRDDLDAVQRELSECPASRS
jgi:indolepyruvate ferredoxin oxidoreductase